MICFIMNWCNAILVLVFLQLIILNGRVVYNLQCGMWQQLDVIGIDEAQFFDDLYDFCCKAADNDGKTIVIAGLDGDYLRC